MAYEEIKDLDSFREVVESLASRIQAPADLLPTYNKSRDGAYPHIELDSRGFHYVVVERGHEQERVTSYNADEILYLVFQGVTFCMACSYEVKHRIEGEDSRRQLFRYQLGLLEQLSFPWRQLREEQMNKTLSRHPFDDQSSPRVEFCVDLRKSSSLTEQEIWVKACEKFPLPQPDTLA